MLVKLTAKTRHGHNRIEQHGEIWEVLFQKDDKFFLQSLEKTFRIHSEMTHDKRWVNKQNDHDFNVEVIDNSQREE